MGGEGECGQEEYGEHYYGRLDLHLTEAVKQSAIRRAAAGVKEFAGMPVLRLETLDGFFTAGNVLESAARSLYVHPNTVRYRLRRVGDVTGLSPLAPRDAYTLRIALTVGRLDPGFTPPQQP